MAQADISAGSSLRSVSIALSILECFVARAELGPSAVAREVGIAKSTASRMLAVLADRGVLERAGGGRYRLGVTLFEYGQLALHRMPLFEASVPILAALRDRVRELVQIGIPSGAEVVILDRFEWQTAEPRFHGPVWRRSPAHGSGTGRAIAAFNPGVEREIFKAGMRRRTRWTIADPKRLAAILEQTRERGWASADEETEEGWSSVAAPVRIGDGDAIAAVGIVGPSTRMRRGGLQSTAAAAQDAAAQIGVALAAS